ncbi:restriction endonuclease subunit S [Bacteroides uniformis]|uniref:restriction endonuclease subunit S n=1 Tax=Bacteroides uniformis TaxID=820 RepID=UPI0039B601E3
MKKYESYKDSGVGWIGKIPSHWSCVPFRRIAKVQCNLVRPSENLTMFQISPDSIEKNSGKIIKTRTVEEAKVDSDNHRFYKGQILYSKIRPLLNKVTIAPYDGLCSADMYPISTIENTEYVMYYMLSEAFLSSVKNIVADRVKMPKINQDELKNTDFVIPPFSEQQVIVDYLKDKTLKIEQYVSARERERELLDSLKQSEIANVVTKGLNSNVRMEDSGIPWIGMIPEHWEVKRLRHFIKFVSVKGHGEKPLLSVTREQGVIERNIESKEENHNFIPDDLSGYKLVRKGQFVINKMKSWQGSYGVSDYEGIVSPAYYVCDLTFPCKKFFSMAIRSKAYIPFFTQYSKGIRVDQWDLSPIGLKSIPFIVPPIEEQQAIVDYIEAKLSKIDSCMADLQAEIDYLKEFKQRLISDVVTGQICVAKPQKGEQQ